MGDKRDQQELNASATTGVIYELLGEPAIVINGVPDLISGCSIVPPLNESSRVERHGNSGLGEWFVGREIRKWFMGRYYSGTVTLYDKESGWYRVLYEDGDTEDLDWKELEEVLLPLDVTISLKALTQRIVRKSKKQIHKSGKNEAPSQNPPIKKSRTKGN